MKQLTILLLLFFAIGTYAQNDRNCVTPVSNYAFQQLFSSLGARQGDAQKLFQAKRIAKENCLSTDQAKQIAEIFENDFNRLAFLQEVYENITDKDNFYEVYNSFTYFSNVFRLHDYVTEHRTGVKVVTEIPQSNVMSFPAYDYPDYRKYFGKIGCTKILSDQEFLQIAENIFKEQSEDKKLSLAYNTTFNNCLQTAQSMKIASLLQLENNRLEFLKKAFYKTFDPDNFKYAIQVFSNDSYKDQFNKFTGGGGSSSVNPSNPPCEVSAQDFANIKNQISKQSFVNTKMNLAKQLIKDKKCFKTAQIAELLDLFTYSDSKMDIAKFSYDYTSDKENYTRLADSFKFSNDKDAFLRFLKTK